MMYSALLYASARLVSHAGLLHLNVSNAIAAGRSSSPRWRRLDVRVHAGFL